MATCTPRSPIIPFVNVSNFFLSCSSVRWASLPVQYGRFVHQPRGTLHDKTARNTIAPIVAVEFWFVFDFYASNETLKSPDRGFYFRQIARCGPAFQRHHRNAIEQVHLCRQNTLYPVALWWPATVMQGIVAHIGRDLLDIRCETKPCSRMDRVHRGHGGSVPVRGRRWLKSNSQCAPPRSEAFSQRWDRPFIEKGTEESPRKRRPKRLGCRCSLYAPAARGIDAALGGAPGMEGFGHGSGLNHHQKGSLRACNP